MKFYTICILSLASLFLACSHSTKKNFESLKVGVPKHEVLEIMGSPTSTQFVNDRNVWTYKFYDNDTLFTKEVHLVNDQVAYLGDPMPAKAKRANKIHEGMGKSYVIDLLGFPKKTRKDGNQDIWLFSFEENSKKLEQEIRFEKDKVVKIGAPLPEIPSKTPAEEDFQSVE